MSDFLERLVSPGLAAPLAVRPLVPSRFESPVDSGFYPAPANLEEKSEEVGADQAGPVGPTQPFTGFGQQVNGIERPLVVDGLEASRGEQPMLPTVDSEVTRRFVAPVSEKPVHIDHRGAQHALIGTDNNEWIEQRLDDLSMQLQKLHVTPGGQQVERHPPTLHSTLDTPKLNQASALNRVINDESWNASASTLNQDQNAGSKQDLQVPPVVSRHTADESGSTSPKESLGREWHDSHDNRPSSAQPPKLVPENLPSSRGQSEPTINVTIGRVEVKAIREPAAAPQASRSQPRTAVMSLEEYLKRRTGGGL